MHLPYSGGFSYIVQGCCSLTHYPEYHMLCKETAQALGDWIFQDILCHWGTLVEIVSNNGKPFVAALAHLEQRYHIKNIRISGYNSKANGIVERSHFDVRQALFKATDGAQSKWPQVAHSVFWSERITLRRWMGCSPYFAVTGTHPLIPLDIIEANYLLPPPGSMLSTTDLVARRAVALQKRLEDLARLRDHVHEACNHAVVHFEQEHSAMVHDFDFQHGNLVLVRNTANEKALNRKMRPRYFGLMIVVTRNRGGAYILCNLDGTVAHSPIADFSPVPYFPRREIDTLNICLNDYLNIPDDRIRELEQTTSADPDDPAVAEVLDYTQPNTDPGDQSNSDKEEEDSSSQ